MISKNTRPNAEQKAWLKAVADFHNVYGLGYLYGSEWDNYHFQIHHVCGRSYKQNKVSIGHFFILPVPAPLHDPNSNHKLNVTHHRHAFTEHFGSQRYLYRRMVSKMAKHGVQVPSSEINNAIMLTKY